MKKLRKFFMDSSLIINFTFGSLRQDSNISNVVNLTTPSISDKNIAGNFSQWTKSGAFN